MHPTQLSIGLLSKGPLDFIFGDLESTSRFGVEEVEQSSYG